MTVEIPPIVSVDDHVVEPPDLWERWLPTRHRAAAPRVIRAPFEILPGGVYRVAPAGPETDWWAFEDARVAISKGFAAAGLTSEEIDLLPVTYRDMRPGFFELSARLADMDENHVERSLCFPTFPRFCGQTFLEAKDKDLGLACIRAYNDWMVEEWCGDSGQRLIPLCLVPLWDPRLAADEVRRNAARGVRAVAFTELPAHLGLPSLHDTGGHWDPFLAACDETGTVICIHIGSSSKFTVSSDDAPRAAKTACTSLNSMLSLVDWLMSGVLVRFPSIRVAFSESQIGWIPFMLERMDNIWQKDRAAHDLNPLLVDQPSTYFAGRVYGCFFEDDFGLVARDAIGVDQITFESDYPHQDSLWPNTRAYAEKAMADLAPDDIRKIVRDNAIRLFDLPDELRSPPRRAHSLVDLGEYRHGGL